MSINVHAHSSGAIEGRTCIIEQARGPSYLGEMGERRDWWNLTTAGNRAILAQADTPEELVKWAKKNGAKRAEVLR